MTRHAPYAESDKRLRAGELSLAIGMLRANGCNIDLDGNKCFTLASDISAVVNATKLDFSGLGLGGPSCLFLCWTT